MTHRKCEFINDLEVRGSDAFSQLLEERNHNFVEL